MINYVSLKQIADLAKEKNKKISDIIIEEQMVSQEKIWDELFLSMRRRYKVMKESIFNGLNNNNLLKIEQIGGAKLYNQYVNNNKSLLGKVIGTVAARAMAVSEVNASMGRICASPTAGSCGIYPAVLVTIEEEYKISEEDMVKAMFTGAGIGLVVSNVGGIAGATGGCQAECGTATAMAAGTVVEILGGTIDQILNAVAISFKNIEGLVCDPVASLVECPCIKRNAHGAVSALLAADLALANIVSIIPVDEVLDAVKNVGNQMNTRLKETAEGGLAATETGKILMKNVLGIEL